MDVGGVVWYSESEIKEGQFQRVEEGGGVRGRARTMACRKNQRLQLDRYWIQPSGSSRLVCVCVCVCAAIVSQLVATSFSA